jgi:hypothetical protein
MIEADAERVANEGRQLQAGFAEAVEDAHVNGGQVRATSAAIVSQVGGEILQVDLGAGRLVRADNRADEAVRDGNGAFRCTRPTSRLSLRRSPPRLSSSARPPSA